MEDSSDTVDDSSSASSTSTTQWSHEAILLLVENYKENRALLNSPNVRKTEVWKKIAAELQSKGYNYTYCACDKKMRALKYRYKLIMDGKETRGKPGTRWDYFELMNSVVAGDALCLIEPQETPPEYVHKAPQSSTWPHDATLHLIQTYSENMELFNSPTTLKMNAWKKVATTMQNMGYNFSYDECDKKMRSLKYRFKVIEGGKEGSGKTRRKWEYYDLMKGLFDDDPSMLPFVTVSPLPEEVVTVTYTPSPTMENDDIASSATGIESHPVIIPDLTLASDAQNTPTLSEHSTASSRKRQRVDSLEEAPAWFLAFAKEQKKELQEIKEIQRNALEVARECNNTLRIFTEALLKKH